MSYIVVSGYSINTPYADEVKNLEESLKKFQVQYKIYPYKSFGTWEKNCQYKSIIINNALIEFGIPIVWIDADAILVKSPEFFNSLNDDIDLSYYTLNSKLNKNELLSGTIYYGNTNKTKDILKEWIELNNSNSAWDQKNLQSIIEKRTDLNITKLPIEYIKINKFETHQGEVKNPVIVHYQASRRFKRKING